MSGEASEQTCLCPSSEMVYSLGWSDLTKKFAYYWNCRLHDKAYNSQAKPSWWLSNEGRNVDEQV